MDPLLISGFATALITIANKLVEKAIVDPALRSGLEPFTQWLTCGYDKVKSQKGLEKAFKAGLKSIKLPVNDDDALVASFQQVGLDRLQSPKNNALREQVALGVVRATSPNIPPSQDVITALAWPRSRWQELSKMLYVMRLELAKMDNWKPLIELADRIAERGLLEQILDGVTPLKLALVETDAGHALQVILLDQNMTAAQIAEIERSYRKSLLDELEMLATQGLSPAQLPKSIRLPLKDVYLELGMIPLRSETERDDELETILAMPEAERLQKEQKWIQQRVGNVLGAHQRLLIVGKPGSGKTVSLKFIALMLAMGLPGALRLRLEAAYIPLYVRLADYAQKLKQNPSLALESFLLQYIQEYYPGKPHQAEFLQIALQKDMCMVLLDGLDEVGDIGDTLIDGKTLRIAVLEEVRRFTERRCKADGCNRIVVTSRIEGYHSSDLSGFTEMEISPLNLPDEVEDFLMRWFSAYEKEYRENISDDAAWKHSTERVQLLMADIMREESVQRLATNPLLLTILAMIHEMGTRLPEQRVRLYETVVKTMVENWRQASTRHTSQIYNTIPLNKIHKLLASLAYWLHENEPGGALPIETWKNKVFEILSEEEDDEKTRSAMAEAVELFLRHARVEVGLLTERSPGQIGFFHLTLEEYLAAVQIARQEGDTRRAMLEKHWQNPRWQEVILLSAGQLMLSTSTALDTFVNDIRVLESQDPALAGRPAILAGKALADVGPENFRRRVLRDVQADLLEVAQDLDPTTGKLAKEAHYTLSTRVEAADALDQLSWRPENLYDFIQIPNSKTLLARYPVTNSQYRRFLESTDFTEKSLWINFPKFSEMDKTGQVTEIGSWDNAGWRWFNSSNKELPPEWKNPRFGILRPSAPVCALTWYEANAYCQWLTKHWCELPESESLFAFLHSSTSNKISKLIFRLPTEPEWTDAAGGEGKPIIIKEEKMKATLYRYPWDREGYVTQDSRDVMRRANISESQIKRTTPVWMYPQGASIPNEFMDLAGNVWEWQANYRDNDRNMLTLRGGSWALDHLRARISARGGAVPDSRWNSLGFRVSAIPIFYS